MESQQRFKIKLAGKIRKLRKENSWTVEELAKKAGLSKSSLNYIERGISDPKLSSLINIGKAFDLSLIDLINIWNLPSVLSFQLVWNLSFIYHSGNDWNPSFLLLKSEILNYDKHITSNHLDVGVGTGYFLDKCHFQSFLPRIALMDLNQNTFDFASNRIKRYTPEMYRYNVLKPISINTPKFDSVGINYLLHCVPGTIEFKSVIFDNLKMLMNSNAIIFGSTLLQIGVTRNWFAKGLMHVYNKKGIFSNKQDSLDGLKSELEKRFQDVTVEVVGCTAIFSGRLSDKK